MPLMLLFSEIENEAEIARVWNHLFESLSLWVWSSTLQISSFSLT